MNEIYNRINEKTSGKYKDVRFSDAAFGDTAEITVVCKPDERDFVAANKGELLRLIDEECGFRMQISLKISSVQPTEQSLRAEVVAFTEKFSYVSSMLHTIKAETDPEYKIKLKMHGAMYDLAQNDYLPRLKEFLANRFAVPVGLDVDVVDFADSGTVASAGGLSRKPVEYALKDVVPVVGTFTPNKALSVAGVTSQGYNVAVCGVYAMPTAYVSKGGRPYERFMLYDGDMSVQCRFMPNENTLLRSELVGKTVCVLGNAEYEADRHNASITVRSLSLCDADGLSAVPIKPEPKQYTTVKPREYEEYVQSSMFDGGFSVPDTLKGDFVVFDFETTGLSLLYDRPTELGAVKISGGSIKEIFTTLIDPRKDIPPEVSEKTGITNEMVKGQPLFEDIIPDFYKFTYGCAVVCHNIPFDFPILLRGANRIGYNFGNRPTFDTMGIAPRALLGLQRLSLDKVLEALGLTNDNAHRALSDAIATAKAFIALQRKLAEIK